MLSTNECIWREGSLNVRLGSWGFICRSRYSREMPSHSTRARWVMLALWCWVKANSVNFSLSTDQSSAELEKMLISYKYIKRSTEEWREETNQFVKKISFLGIQEPEFNSSLHNKVISVSLGFKWGNRPDAGHEVEMFYLSNWRLQITDSLLTGPISLALPQL